MLCLAALAVAAPQLDLGDLKSVQITRDGIDREKVVSQVVAGLTPEIRSAVAQQRFRLQLLFPQEGKLIQAQDYLQVLSHLLDWDHLLLMVQVYPLLVV